MEISGCCLKEEIKIANSGKTSPFTPGSPVPYELFVGRQEQCCGMQVDVRKMCLCQGKEAWENVLTWAYIEKIAVSRENFMGVHVFLGGGYFRIRPLDF